MPQTYELIANFAYAGTEKYCSHAVLDGKTLCGLAVADLCARANGEWEIVEQETIFMGRVVREPFAVGCRRCAAAIEKRAASRSERARPRLS